MITTQIPIDELEIGCWYIGRGRNSNIGQWNGEMFAVIAQCDHPVSWKPRKYVTEPRLKFEFYYTEDEGTFQPFIKIDEGELLEPFGSIGWDAHYGSKMQFYETKK